MAIHVPNGYFTCCHNVLLLEHSQDTSLAVIQNTLSFRYICRRLQTNISCSVRNTCLREVRRYRVYTSQFYYRGLPAKSRLLNRRVLFDLYNFCSSALTWSLRNIVDGSVISRHVTNDTALRQISHLRDASRLTQMLSPITNLLERLQLIYFIDDIARACVMY